MNSKTHLKIVLCSPELKPLQQAMNGEPTNATYLIQRQIAKRLQGRGHDLMFIAQHYPGMDVYTKDVNVLHFPDRTWSSSYFFRSIKKLSWQIQKLLKIPYINVFSNLQLFDACVHCLPENDIVYERNGMFRDGVAMACKRLNLPYILYVEADEILEYEYMGQPIAGLLRWRAKKAFRYNLNSADKIICVSEPLKEHLVYQWKIPVEKIYVFPNGVDAELFRPFPVEGKKLRKSLGVDTNPFIIFVGNFYEWHDVRILLDSFAWVLNSHPDARLVLVGDGTTRQEMEMHADNLGITHAVKFTGLLPHAEVPYYISAADIAVVPYPVIKDKIWLSPLKLFEYMASGKAIIASGVGQLLDVVQDGFNSLLVPPGDTARMADALFRFIEDDELRIRLGKQAREDAISKHSWEQYITNLEELFVTTIREKSG